jgi:hypothetical protein
MSKANETNQTKPIFKIERCHDCPANTECCLYEYGCNGFKVCETRKKIERLVNRSRLF